jgi:hypothetical protein
MSGGQIEQARECFSLFIRSVPAISFGNIVRFGSRFLTRFPEAVNYNEATSKRAVVALFEGMQCQTAVLQLDSELERMSALVKDLQIERRAFK